MVVADSQTFRTSTGNAGVIGNNGVSLLSFLCINGGASLFYLQFFNKASAPVVNDVPFDQYPIPASGLGEQGLDNLQRLGEPYPLGLAWGISSTLNVFTPVTTPTFYLKIRYNS